MPIGTRSAVEIQYLSSEGRVVVWESRPFETVIEETHLLVQGLVRKDGFLAIRVIVDGKMIYPRKRHRNEDWQKGTSITLTDVDLAKVTETYACSVEHVRAIALTRAKVAGTVQSLG